MSLEATVARNAIGEELSVTWAKGAPEEFCLQLGLDEIYDYTETWQESGEEFLERVATEEGWLYSMPKHSAECLAECEKEARWRGGVECWSEEQIAAEAERLLAREQAKYEAKCWEGEVCYRVFSREELAAYLLNHGATETPSALEPYVAELVFEPYEPEKFENELIARAAKLICFTTPEAVSGWLYHPRYGLKEAVTNRLLGRHFEDDSRRIVAIYRAIRAAAAEAAERGEEA